MYFKTPYRGTRGFFKTLAHHEAAHAVVCARFGIAFRFVTVAADGSSHVQLGRRGGTKSRQRIENELIMSLAGSIATGRIDPALKNDGAFQDTIHAYSLAADILHVRNLDCAKMQKYMAGMRKDAEAVVTECWPQIKAVAKELQTRKRLEFSDVKRICAAA